MSLTSLIKDKSWLRDWLETKVNPVSAQKFVNHHNNLMHNASIGFRQDNNTSVGTAASYVLRYFIEPKSWLSSIAATQKDASHKYTQIYGCIETLLQDIEKTDKDKDLAIAVASCLMSKLETIGRGTYNYWFLPIVAESKDYKNLCNYLYEKEPDVVRDVYDITKSIRFNTAQIEIIPPNTKTRVISNPSFSLSKYVQGADAQLISGNTLYDIRTSWKNSPMTVEYLYQQVCYYLLDEHNEYNITNFAWYYSRHEALFTHPVDRLIRNPVELRKEFSNLCKDKISNKSAVDLYLERERKLNPYRIY